MNKALKLIVVDENNQELEYGSFVYLGGEKMPSSSPFEHLPTVGGNTYQIKPIDLSKTLEERAAEKEAEKEAEKQKYAEMGYDLHCVTYETDAKTFSENKDKFPKFAKQAYEEVFGKIEITREKQHITNPYPIEEKQTIFERVKNLKVFSGMEYVKK